MSVLAGIRTVIFDLDGTLLDRRSSFEQFVRDQWRRFDVLQAVDQSAYVRTAIELDDNGYAPRRALFPGTLARLGLNPEPGDALLRDYRAGFPGTCVLFPGARQTLARVRSEGFKLGLITNGSVRMQGAKLECLALAPAFDAVLISDAEGVSKPEPEIFRRALERLGSPPGHAVYVGDHPEFDIDGARRAGMKAVWRRNDALAPPLDADAAIDELADLLPLLGLSRI